jgi:pilus assembly protein CpaB
MFVAFTSGGSMRSTKKRILIAVVAGLLSAGLLSLYLSNLQAKSESARADVLATYGGEQVDVFIATRDIAAGETLGQANVAIKRWVADLLPSGALTDMEKVYGATLNTSLLKGEPIIASKIGIGADPVSVPDGLCALTVAVDDVHAVGGAVGRGSAVNVYATGQSGVALVACDVLVLETSNGLMAENAASHTDSGMGFLSSSKTRTALKWVTLAVRPNMVQEILAAAQSKNLTLVLPGLDADFSDSSGFEQTPQMGED